MNNNDEFNEEDKGLASFLKKNAPEIPEASYGLEDRIMRSISAEKAAGSRGTGLIDKIKNIFNPYIFIPASVAVAALLIVTIVIPRGNNVRNGSVDFAETEEFIEYVWETGYDDYLDDTLTNEINEIMEI